MSDIIDYSEHIAWRYSESVRTHYQSFTVGVVLPAVQAGLTGLFVGLASGILGAIYEVQRAWLVGLAVWAAVQALTWVYLLARWLGLIWRLEVALGVDLNHDNCIGDPEDEPEPVRIEVIQEQGRHVQFADLPASEEQLIQLGAGLASGLSFSESNWTGRDATFSRSEFRTLRDMFVRRRWLEWRNPNAKAQGLELTGPGQAVCRYFASIAAADLPQLKTPAAEEPAAAGQEEIITREYLTYHPIMNSPNGGNGNGTNGTH